MFLPSEVHQSSGFLEDLYKVTVRGKTSLASAWPKALFLATEKGYEAHKVYKKDITSWNLFKDRLRTLLGKNPDPWGIKDSFTASALYLSGLGASAQTSVAENKAAARYYGQAGAYNSGVMNRATCIQTFIDNGTMSTYCENLIF